MTVVLEWIIFGALFGSIGSYLLYKMLHHDEEAQEAALIGAGVGAVGGPILLVPLWAYWYIKLRNTLSLAAATYVGEVDILAVPPPTFWSRTWDSITDVVPPLKKLNLAVMGRALIYAFLVFMVLVYLMPVYTVVTTSFKARNEAGKLDKTEVWKPPTSLHWEGYKEAWDVFGPKFKNSFVLTFSATFLSAVMGSLNGYVLAKWRFPGANIIFPLMLFGMFIPYQSILIPLFQFIDSINLGGTIQGLILVHVVYGLPITTLIFRNYYAEVPTEMLEAGAIDGAGFFGLYFRIVFPLSLPGFVVVIIWQFTQIWNELLFALTLTAGTGADPITVKLAELAGGEAVAFNVVMSGAVLAALPTLVVYIVLGRYFIRGLLAGSVKG
jgi:glucose/mannose transport system permease protein